MRLFFFVLMFVFTTLCLHGQQYYFQPYVNAGGTVWKIDSFNVSNGPNFGVGFTVHKHKHSDVTFEFYAKGEATYKSFFGAYGLKHQFIHVRGGGGLTDGEWFYSGLTTGVLTTMNGRSNSVITMDFDLSITLPLHFAGQNVQIMLNGNVGGAFDSIYKNDFTHKPLYLAASVAARWNLGIEY